MRHIHGMATRRIASCTQNAATSQQCIHCLELLPTVPALLVCITKRLSKFQNNVCITTNAQSHLYPLNASIRDSHPQVEVGGLSVALGR